MLVFEGSRSTGDHFFSVKDSMLLGGYCWWKKICTTWHAWNPVSKKDIYHINWWIPDVFSINSLWYEVESKKRLFFKVQVVAQITRLANEMPNPFPNSTSFWEVVIRSFVGSWCRKSTHPANKETALFMVYYVFVDVFWGYYTLSHRDYPV